MMARMHRRVLAAFFVISCVPAHAFELATHAKISDRAYERSVLGVNTFLTDRLGFVDTPDVFGNQFYDVGPFFTVARVITSYELEKMPAGELAESRSTRIRGWLMRGAIREDDGEGVATLWAWEPFLRDPDPFGPMNRFCNHFFDPVFMRGLIATDSFTSSFCDANNRRRAVDWATGAADPFAATTAAVDGYRNHFSIYAAREAMWRALTLRDRNWLRLFRTNGDSDYRMQSSYWATTFRALGDVVHVIQDMAQPQHARNEPHGYGHAAKFEKYLEGRANGDRIFDVDELSQSVTFRRLPLLVLEPDYPIPVFKKYSSYWTTSQETGGGGVALGKGLADYSNRGFLTPGKWLNDSGNEYVLPNRDPSTYVSEVVTAGANDCGAPGMKVTYLKGAVPDTVLGGSQTIRVAAANARAGTFILNNCIFDERAALLLPRAVAYSAGFINHFFRGKLTISLPDDGVYAIVDHSVEKSSTSAPAQGFRKIKLKVKNETPPLDGVAQHMNAGMVAAVVKFRRNPCYTETLSGEWGSPDMVAAKGAKVFDPPSAGGCRTAEEEIVVSDLKSGVNLAAGAEMAYEFTFAEPIPINATDVFLQVVFRGKLGDEDDAVVVETKDIGEPGFTAYGNFTDYLFCYNGVFSFRGPNGEFPAELATEIPDGNTRYPPGPLTNVKIAFQPYDADPAARPLLTIASLPVKSYVRFAWLGDLDHSWGFTLDMNGSPFSRTQGIGGGNPRTLANQVYVSFDGIDRITKETHAAKVSKRRFHYSAHGRFFDLAQGTSCDATPYPAEDRGDVPALLPVTIVERPAAP